MNLADHENDGDEGRKERWWTKEPERDSGILIFIFELHIQKECPISRQQKSRIVRQRIEPGMKM